MGVPQNGWFITENPIKKEDFRVPPFVETPKWINTDKSGAKHRICMFPAFIFGFGCNAPGLEALLHREDRDQNPARVYFIGLVEGKIETGNH